MIPTVPHHRVSNLPTQCMVHVFQLTKLWALSQRLARHVSSCLLGLWEWGAFLYHHHSIIQMPAVLSCHVPPGSGVSMETVRSDSMQAACGSVWVGTGRCGEEPVPPLQHPKSGDLSSHTQTHTHLTILLTAIKAPLDWVCAPPLGILSVLINQCFVRLWWISSQNVF